MGARIVIVHLSGESDAAEMCSVYGVDDLDRIADNVMETKGGAPIGMMKKLGREDVLSILRRAF